MIASVSTSSKIVVEKSTVPVKTAEAIEKASALGCSSRRCCNKYCSTRTAKRHYNKVSSK